MLSIPTGHLIPELATRLRSFLFEEKVKAYSAAYGRGCAFAATPPADRSLKFGEVLLMGLDSPAPTQVQTPTSRILAALKRVMIVVRSNMGFMQLATGARPILMNGVYTIPNGSPEQAI
jgi:hypothetical protein